jgi:cysteine desulfurase/selenocysteine lyase
MPERCGNPTPAAAPAPSSASAAWAEHFPLLAPGRSGIDALAYLDNAATTQTPQAVLDAVRRFECEQRANIHRGVHRLSQGATEAFEQARDTLKRHFGADARHELVFTSGTTEALNLVAHGLSDARQGRGALGAGRRDHRQRARAPRQPAALAGRGTAQRRAPAHPAARRRGALARGRSGGAAGRAHPRVRADRLRQRHRRASALRGAAGPGGTRQCADPCSTPRRWRAHALPALAALDCDFMVLSGHKMYGPMGIGALLGRRTALERLQPLRLGGDMVDWVNEQRAGLAALPARLEGGTPNVAGAVGMAAAARFVDGLGARGDRRAHCRPAGAGGGWAGRAGRPARALAPQRAHGHRFLRRRARAPA